MQKAAPSASDPAAVAAPISLIMPTIDGGATMQCCLRAARAALGPRDELLVVFDGVAPSPPPAWLVASGATVLQTGQRSGPGAARNLGAQKAQTEILLFVDADVELHPDAVERVRRCLQTDPACSAVFGSYDDRPRASGVVSRFRNLLHHHTHCAHPGPATTFWAGCGAVRRQAFLAVGGFDAVSYRHPSIEDIELGLRLSDSGASITLDPSIQGTHHKRWTLRSMLSTDIGRRAIPWSRLLLQRRELPATLNLSNSARFSAAASLLLPLATVGLAWQEWRPWALLAWLASFALLVLLNRSLYSLLLRRGGVREGCAGIGLHALYLNYSSLSFAAVALTHALTRPLPVPGWLRGQPRPQRLLVVGGLGLLAVLGLTATLNGLMLGWRLNDTDIYQRVDEWRLFKEGIYPSGALATAEERALPYFHTSVYLPWALPLFGLLFGWHGVTQGIWMIQGLSLLSLALMARIGWRLLRPWGPAAGWLGALTPLAIAANSNALAQGQFSIVCVGLLCLQGLLMLRQRPLPAGLCWALAMVKPQIAVGFALPLLVRGQRRGLALGLGLLSLFSALALLHTQTPPLDYLNSWLALLPKFVGVGNSNVTASLIELWRSPAWAALLLAVMASLTALVWLVRAWGRSAASSLRLGQLWWSDPLPVAGLIAVVNMLAFYHLNYDNILLAPALLAAWRLTLERQRLLEGVLVVLTTVSLCTPQRLLELLPGVAQAQALIWLALAIRLLVEVLRPGQPGIGLAATAD